MKTLVLFAGLPGVGKSTISRGMSDGWGAELVDIDDFKKTAVDLGLVKSQIDPPEVRRAYYKTALEHVFGRFDQGVTTVVMDEVFHLQALRAELEHECRKRQIIVVWVEVRCAYETVEKRLLSKSREGHILSTDEALKMHLLFASIFEPFPPRSGNHYVINNDQGDVDLLVKKLLLMK